MSVATISIKGQLTLPARMRRKLGIQPKDRVTIEQTDDAIVIRKAGDLFHYKGFLGKPLPANEERKRMQEAVVNHVKGAAR